MRTGHDIRVRAIPRCDKPPLATNRYDRSAIMKDAHRRYAAGRRLGMGWTFGRCLSTAWAAEKMRGAVGRPRGFRPKGRKPQGPGFPSASPVRSAP